MSAASLSLGPLLFLWNGPKWRDFYFRIADEAPISHVTVGEIVCSKRFHFMAPYMDAVIERLQRAGKEVSLGSLALVMLEREAKQIRQMIEKATLPVEANDLSALGLCRVCRIPLARWSMSIMQRLPRFCLREARTRSACRPNFPSVRSMRSSRGTRHRVRGLHFRACTSGHIGAARTHAPRGT